MPDDFIFQSVILRIDPAGQHQHTAGKFSGVFFASGKEFVFSHHSAAILPEFAETGVEHDLQFLGIVVRIKEFFDDAFP